MKKTCLTITLLLLIATTQTFAEGINFTTGKNWKALLAHAKKEKKIIFLDAYTTWCGPCKYLQQNVFTNSDVGSYYNKTFINVKIDMEEGEGLMLSEKYGVTAYPTLFYINSDGELLHKSIGALDGEALILLGQKATDPNKQFYTVKKEAAKGKVKPADFHDWIHMAIEIDDNNTDQVIKSFLENSKSPAFDVEMLKIRMEHTDNISLSLADSFYNHRKEVEKITGYSSAEFDEYMLHKIIKLGETESLVSGRPDFNLFNSFITKYQPQAARLETEMYKFRYYSEKKEEEKKLDILISLITDSSFRLSAINMAYMVIINADEIKEKNRSAEFINAVAKFQLLPTDHDKAYTINLSLATLYAKLNNREKVNEFAGKVLEDENASEKLKEMALEL